jgi:transposase
MTGFKESPMESPLAVWVGLLAEWSRTDPDPRVRRRAPCLVVLDASPSQCQAARLVGVDPKTLRRWTQRFLAKGREGLADRPRLGRSRKLDAAAETFIERVLSELPTVHGYATATWTLADLQKRGLITQAEYDSCISTNAICTPITTWERSGNREGLPVPSLRPGSIGG